MNTYAHSSQINIRAQITAPEGKDPTSDPVQMAFTATGTAPEVTDPGWQAASWEPVVPAIPPNPQFYFCRTMIGPSPGHTLAPGVYFVWVRITDNPEAPVIPAGSIKVV